jgi:NTE family protein
MAVKPRKAWRDTEEKWALQMLAGAPHGCTEETEKPMSTSTTQSTQKIADDILVDPALQGGGAHGAFTWGVLDRLLEEKRLRIDGISGTSAGAMNAAVLADGYTDGGPDGARKALETFWAGVSRSARFSPFQRGPLDVLLGRCSLDHSPMFVAMDMMSRIFSPYDLDPHGANPLHDATGR